MGNGYPDSTSILDVVLTDVAESTNQPTSSGAAPGTPRDAVHDPSLRARRSGRFIFAGFVAVMALMIGTAAYRSSYREDIFTVAQKELARDLAKLPFTARLPEPAPAGTKLVRVITQEPDKKRGPSIYAMETTYSVVGGTSDGSRTDYIRIWQTNDVYLRKQVLDPLGDRLNPTKLKGQTWFRRSGQSLDDPNGVSYSTRFSDGITVVVSGTDEQLVLSAIDTLELRPEASLTPPE